MTIEDAITQLVDSLAVVPITLSPQSAALIKEDYKKALVDFSKAIIDEMVKDVVKVMDDRLKIHR